MVISTFFLTFANVNQFKTNNKIMERDYREFQNEMARLSAITYKGYQKTLKEIGISYIASPNSSSKLMHNGRMNMLTYGLYLASYLVLYLQCSILNVR